MAVPSACQKSGFGHFFEFCSLSLIAALPAAKGCKETILQAKSQPRPAGKPGGYEYSRRACGPSDATFKFVDSRARRRKGGARFFFIGKAQGKRVEKAPFAKVVQGMDSIPARFVV